MANVGLYMVMVFALLTLGANAAATYIICRTYFEMKNRRRNQVIFVWLVPLIGALLAILINREEYFYQKRQKQVGNDPNITESQAVSFGVAANNHGGR